MLLGLSIIIFVLSRLSGDPVALMLPLGASRQDEVHLRQVLGLDRSYPVQYGLFIVNAVTGDFGTSLRARRPVSDLIRERLPNSAKLAAFAMGVSFIIAIPLGVIAATRKGRPVDALVRVVAILGQSMPIFWLGILFIEIFAVRLKVLPVYGMGGIDHYILPGVAMGWFQSAAIMRLQRSSMLEVLDSEFVKMARIKGLRERVVIWKHALRNAMIPVVTYGGIYFAVLISSAVVVETVFAWPGVGRLVYEAIMNRDYPVAQGVVLTAAAIVVVVNLAVDLLYVYLDPRVKYR